MVRKPPWSYASALTLEGPSGSLVNLQQIKRRVNGTRKWRSVSYGDAETRLAWVWKTVGGFLHLDRDLVPSKKAWHERRVVLIHHHSSLGCEALPLESFEQVLRNSCNFGLPRQG